MLFSIFTVCKNIIVRAPERNSVPISDQYPLPTLLLPSSKPSVATSPLSVYKFFYFDTSCK